LLAISLITVLFMNVCVDRSPAPCAGGSSHTPRSRHSPPCAASAWQGCSWVPAGAVREVWFVSADNTRRQAAGPLGRRLFVQVRRQSESFHPFPQVPNCLHVFTGCSGHSATAHRSHLFASAMYTTALRGSEALETSSMVLQRLGGAYRAPEGRVRVGRRQLEPARAR